MKSLTLITGAAGGLGLETARHLARRGHRVILTARDESRGQAAVADLQREGLAAEFVRLDVTDEDSIASAAAEIQRRHGRLDALINNAAILVDHYQATAATTVAQLRQTLETNVFGPHAVLLAFAPLLKAAPAARVVNVSSGAGQLHDMSEGVWAPAYQASKTALNALTCLWAAELKPAGIPVNAACPGWCRTEMGGAGAPRSPEQGAASIAWLLTDAPREESGKFWRDGSQLDW